MSYDKPDYTKPCGFLIGNEGNGLSDEIADLADNYIKIPMAGKVESLNAAISATLLMYECTEAKEGEGMRIWFKIFKDTHLLKEETIEDESTDTRTHKVFNALEEACLRFDLAKPIWSPKILRNLKKVEKPVLQRTALWKI